MTPCEKGHSILKGVTTTQVEIFWARRTQDPDSANSLLEFSGWLFSGGQKCCYTTWQNLEHSKKDRKNVCLWLNTVYLEHACRIVV